MKTTLKDVKEKLSFDTYSVKNGIFTVRKSFFYTMGKRSSDYVAKVKTAFPNAEIVDFGEVWKTFRGGSSVANGSHWYVKFSVPE